MTFKPRNRMNDFTCDFCGLKTFAVVEVNNQFTLPEGWDSTPRIFYSFEVTHIPWEHACKSCQYEIKTLLRKLKESSNEETKS